MSTSMSFLNSRHSRCRAWSDSDSLTTHSVTPRRRRNDATMVIEAAHTDVRKHGRSSLLRGHKIAPITLRAYPSQGPVALRSPQNARRFAHRRRLIEQMTYSRVEVRRKTLFPMTTSISDKIVRRLDLPRAGFDGCLCCGAGRNCTFLS